MLEPSTPKPGLNSVELLFCISNCIRALERSPITPEWISTSNFDFRQPRNCHHQQRNEQQRHLWKWQKSSAWLIRIKAPAAAGNADDDDDSYVQAAMYMCWKCVRSSGRTQKINSIGIDWTICCNALLMVLFAQLLLNAGPNWWWQVCQSTYREIPRHDAVRPLFASIGCYSCTYSKW